MCHPAILGRRLEREAVNIGFSGNGRMELELADLLCEIDAAVYVLDCLPNMGAAEVKERTEPFVTADAGKEAKHAAAASRGPDLLRCDLPQGETPAKRRQPPRYRAAFDRLKAAGVKGLYYLEGENLLGEDNEGTVDSSHPTDLGFWRQADAMTPILKTILGQQ